MDFRFKYFSYFFRQALQVPSAVTYNLYDFSFDDIHMSDDDTLLVIFYFFFLSTTVLGYFIISRRNIE